jgi:hypothetical protein
MSIASFFGGPDLTPEAQAVRSISDGSGCRFIESSHLESRAQFIQDYVKRNAAEIGGDSYKIVNVSQDYAVGIPISVVSYEVYNCREKPAPKVELTPADVQAVDPDGWGSKRCDLVPNESREPCMAAHVRLSIPSDQTLPESRSSQATDARDTGAPAVDHVLACEKVEKFVKDMGDEVLLWSSGRPSTDDRKSSADRINGAYPDALKHAAFWPELRAAVKEYAIALKAFAEDAGATAQKVEVEHAKASLEIELAAACGPQS